MAKALPVEVYKASLFEGCSNGGISEKYDEVLLLCDEGFVDVDLNNPPENLCKMVYRKIGCGIFVHAEPYAKPEHIGWMNGGSIIHSFDSRFSRMSEYPVRLHDRQETREEYDVLSR